MAALTVTIGMGMHDALPAGVDLYSDGGEDARTAPIPTVPKWIQAYVRTNGSGSPPILPRISETGHQRVSRCYLKDIIGLIIE